MKRSEQKLRLRTDWSESKLQSVLDKILQLSSINSDGAMSWSDFKIDVYFSVAYEAFQKIDSVPDRELSSIIRRAIITKRKQGNIRASDVISEAKRLVREYDQKPLSRFTTATDIAIDLPVNVPTKRFKYRDVTLEVTRRVPKFMKDEINPDSSRSPYGASPEMRYALLITRCLARTESEAVSKSFDASSVFLGITNISAKRWNIMGGEQKPQALIAQGPYNFVFKEHKVSGGQWYNPNFREQYWRSTKLEGQKFVESARYIGKALLKLGEHPLRETLVNILVTLNEGIESHILSERMIHYWSAIERLFAEENEKVPYDKIIRRATFLEYDQSEARLFLSHLVHMRNNKVHRGRSFDHQHQLIEYSFDFIRRFTLYLIFNGEDINSHLEFLEMADLPNDRAALARRQLAIERRIRFIETRRHR